MKEYNVFVSYSRKDDINFIRDTGMPSPVDLILKRFKDEGIKFWIDREGKFSGANFIFEITKALSNSELVLFISSKNSNDDGEDESGNIKAKWVRREILEADDNNMKIIPMRIDETPYNPKIKMVFNGIDAIEYFKDPEKGLDDLVGSIKRHLYKIKEAEKKRAEAEAAALRRMEEEKERARKEAEEKERIEKLESEIEGLKKRIVSYVDKQQTLMKELLSKEKELNKSEKRNKECPVCCTPFSDLDTDYCDICGWHFATPKELVSPSMQLMYDDRLQVSQSIWRERRHNKENIDALKKENIDLEVRLKKFQGELDEWKDKYNSSSAKNKELIQNKSNEISILKKELGDTNSQLSKAQQKVTDQNKNIDTLKKKIIDLEVRLKKLQEELDEWKNKYNSSSSIGKQPIAFLLVTEFDQMNVYCLYEGRNLFGAKQATSGQSDYQMLVVSDNYLKPLHFEVCIRRENKRFFFSVLPIDETCVLALNSKSNSIKGENSIQLNDMLFIGDVKIQIIDNFNKTI